MFDNGLKCSVPGCKKVIRAMTGLQELTKLRQHMKRVHLANWTAGEALENRAEIERRQEPKGV